MNRSTRPNPALQKCARDGLLERVLKHARNDERILAVLDYGSTSEGRGDAWSDIDLALAIDAERWDGFLMSWRDWLARSGEVLDAFEAFPGHPWAVLNTEAAPVRVDLHLYGGPPDIDLEKALAAWPNAPTSVEAMLLYDRDNTLSDSVELLVGRSLAPLDEAETFSNIASHFWYYVHRTWSKLQRASDWDVRWNITHVLTGNLCALLRLESGATDRWLASDAASGIEHAISNERLAQLNACIPGTTRASLNRAFGESIELGAVICDVLGERYGTAWPKALAMIMQRYTQSS